MDDRFSLEWFLIYLSYTWIKWLNKKFNKINIDKRPTTWARWASEEVLFRSGQTPSNKF